MKDNNMIKNVAIRKKAKIKEVKRCLKGLSLWRS